MPRDRSTTSGAPFRLSWPALFGGLFAALGVWLLLYAFGLALGLSQLDAEQPNLARALGLGTSLWVVLTSFVSMFVGGLVTARSAGYLGRGNGALHGIVLWGAAAFVSALALGSMVGSVASQLAQAGAQAISRFDAAAAVRAAGVDTGEVLTQLNAQLTAAGRPSITADELRAAAEDAVGAAVSQGRLDQELLIGALAENTQLSEHQARALFAGAAERLGQRFALAKGEMARGAARLAQATGRIFWSLFALLALSLLGSVLGASTGVSRRQRELVTSTLPPPLPMGARPGEAYP